MLKVISKRGQSLTKLCERQRFYRKKHIEEKVRRIINDIHQNGDEALAKYTKRFDNATLSPRQFRVPESEISAAYQNITADFIEDLKIIIHNVTRFYTAQKQKPCRIKDGDGVHITEKITPLDSVGIYIPAGTAPLISSVYMTAIPALVAGVKRIALITPPDRSGQVHPHILAVANMLKISEIYKAGGAQAVAALAIGTRMIPKVDKIVGPGNMFVTEAKRQLFGFVDIDMLAGPTELVVIANRHTNPDYVIADMEAQAEHIGGLSILITTSKQLLKKVRGKISSGYGIYARNIDEAVAISNDIAPEHLEILTNNPRSVCAKIRHAGAIFLGPYSPTALGDYAAGPSHVLPTLGTARFSSGICLSDFEKKSHIIQFSKRALQHVRGPIEKVANLEGLPKHYESIAVRFK